MATVRSRRVSRALYTSPMPPAPMAERISYGPRRAPGERAMMSRADCSTPDARRNALVPSRYATASARHGRATAPRLTKHMCVETPHDPRRHADLFDVCQIPHPDPRGICETLAEIHLDASSLTLTRAEAHDSANPAPSLIPGAQGLLQWRATPGRLSHAIVRLLYRASGNLSALAVYVELYGRDAAGAILAAGLRHRSEGVSARHVSLGARETIPRRRRQIRIARVRRARRQRRPYDRPDARLHGDRVRREPDDRGRTDTRAHAHLEEEALKETS